MRHALLMLLVIVVLAIPVTAAAGWEQLPGQAVDIAVSGGDNAYCIGTNRTDGGGYGAWSWTGSNWQAIGGAGVRIATDRMGRAWVVNDQNRIWLYDRGNWQKVSGAATDIACGGGQVWIVGVTKRGDGGYGIWKLTGPGNWQRIPGAAMRIAVDNSGMPWVVSASGSIYHWDGMNWQSVPGQARDIGAGGNSIWIISARRASGGYEVYRWNGMNWGGAGGSGTAISVDSRARAWICNYEGRIYRWR